MLKHKRKPVPIWLNKPPASDTRAAMKEYNWRERNFIRKNAKEIPVLVPYIIESGSKRACVIVCPGGGYHGRAEHEGEKVALWLNSLGINSFVLNYRVAPFRFPVEFLDAQRAVRFVRANAEIYSVDPEKIGMIGFSAGGHLAAMLGTFSSRDWFPGEYRMDEIDRFSDRLNFMILAYALTNMEHSCSRRNLIGKNPEPAMMEMMYVDRQVSPETPPAFLWSTMTDSEVSFTHSVNFGKALFKNGVSHEIHIFETGAHGLGLAEGNAEVHRWVDLCADWFRDTGIIQDFQGNNDRFLAD